MRKSELFVSLFLIVLATANCRSSFISESNLSSGLPSAPPQTEIPRLESNKKNNAEQIVQTAEKFEDFVPKTAKLIEKVEGDLNADGKPDAALIWVSNENAAYKSNGEEHQSNFHKRCLAVVLRNSNNKYERDALSDKIIFPASDFDSPNSPSNEVKMTIANNILILKQTNGLSLNTVKDYEHRLKKTNEGWKIISGTIRETDIHSDKTTEIKQKQSISLNDFDIEKIESN